MKYNIKAVWMLTALVLLLASCRKREAVLADNLVSFQTNEAGINASENSISLSVKTSRAVNENIAVVINVTNMGLQYGTHYTTTPAASASGVITLFIPSGNNEANLVINKVPNVLYDGSEKIVFDIYSSAAPVIIGNIKQLTLSFAELVSTHSSMTINGGGTHFTNKVFIDLSAHRQTAVSRTSWDLGFYSGANDYHVTLNSSVNMMVKQLNKTDLNTVGTADTIGFANDVSFSQTNPLGFQLPFIDYPDGDLAKTAIAPISSNAADNKVYIINRGNEAGISGQTRGWKKIRIIRNSSGGYTLQYADIAATTFSSLDVFKDGDNFFNHVSFENGLVIVAPHKDKWDIAWSYFANVVNFGGGEVPYMYQDVILLNRNVQVAKVMTATKAFDNFAEADIASQTFLTTQNAIGPDWRSGGGPGSSPSVRSDRYYIVKDVNNNYYKIRFTALSQGGQRGFPSFESVLVKKG